MTTQTAMVAEASLAPRPILSIEGSLSLGETTILRDMHLEVFHGEVLALLGPSGCGKSTLLRVMLGLASGALVGRVHRHAPDTAIGMVFQKPTLLPWRTARANVELCLCIGPTKVDSPAERTRRATEALEVVGLGGFAGHYPYQLSGGMQQRVAIARALVAAPSLLLMDEPFGALDELTRASMNQELLRLWEGSKTRLETIVMVTHSITEALLVADRVVVLTGRPARVATVFEPGFGRERAERFPQIEGTAHFQELSRAVRARLHAS